MPPPRARLNANRQSAYHAWVRERRATGLAAEAYLFDERRVRFEPQGDDLLIAEPGARVVERQGALHVDGPSPAAATRLRGVLTRQRASLARLLASCDGSRTHAELRKSPESALLPPLLDAAFGLRIFAPLAVSELNRRIPGVEVVRFPGSPYEIVRSYWSNMADVRERLHELPEALLDTDDFVPWLRELHATLLTGGARSRFYLPASPIGMRRANPGALHDAPLVLEQRGSGLVIESGLRVNVSTVGGRWYHQLAWQSVGDEEAAWPREHREAGRYWGRWFRGRAASETEERDWFCPPRPTTRSHFDRLRTTLAAARACPAHDERLNALADFHQCFVRLHPFACGNQALAMNLVNHVLGDAHSSGVPHLILDQFALRMTRAAYAALFVRAVRCYQLPDATAAARQRATARLCQSAFELSTLLEAATSLAEARAIADSHPVGASALLLNSRA